MCLILDGDEVGGLVLLVVYGVEVCIEDFDVGVDGVLVLCLCG